MHTTQCSKDDHTAHYCATAALLHSNRYRESSVLMLCLVSGCSHNTSIVVTGTSHIVKYCTTLDLIDADHASDLV
eukprot:9095-Heterococcus_DN1.PRE.2